jgi:hypothetical protein
MNLNKHYPITKCWMDEQTLPNYKMLDGWTNTTQLQNIGWMNKHYPITKCWMDEQTLPNYKNIGWTVVNRQEVNNHHYELVMPWTNFQTHGDILKLWSSLSLFPQLGWMVELRNIFLVFNYNFRAKTTTTTTRKENTSVCFFCPFLKAYLD